MRIAASKTFLFAAFLGLCAVGALPGDALAQAAAASSPVAPTFIPVSGRLVNPDGQPRTGGVTLIISLYDTQTETLARWTEQQQVVLDATGAYTVQFGVNSPDGLPPDLFSENGGARWLAVAEQVTDSSGNPTVVEQPRVMLVSVPYASKAASAETLGGRSASDFVLTSTFREDLRSALEEEGVTGGDGDVGTLAISENRILKGDAGGQPTDSSSIFESAAGNVGIGTTSPAAKLHIVGTTRFGTNDHATGGALIDGTVRMVWGTGVPTPPAGVWSMWHESTDGSLRFKASNGGTNFVVDDGGNVGIGTSAPRTNSMSAVAYV
jgi:hypothetical protein